MSLWFVLIVRLIREAEQVVAVTAGRHCFAEVAHVRRSGFHGASLGVIAIERRASTPLRLGAHEGGHS